MGLLGETDELRKWYGGQVQHRATLFEDDGGRFAVRLEPLEKRRSYRIARDLGSRRVLQLCIPDKFLKRMAKVKQFLRQKFVLCGRVYIPLHPKDNSVYMIETDENYGGRIAQMWCGDQYRLSFHQFVQRHNPLDLNADQVRECLTPSPGFTACTHLVMQPISKWCTRFSIGFSTSIPVLEFRQQNVEILADIIGWF